jgi:hypothetical protein
MNNDELFGYIGKLKDHSIQFKLREISEGDEYNYEQGDEYNYEQGAEYHFQILGNKYNVGYVYITEDDDDWAQAECYENNWCLCNGEHIKSEEVYKIIENYKSVVRDKALNDLGI